MHVSGLHKLDMQSSHRRIHGKTMNRLSQVKMGFTYEEPYITYQQYNSGRSMVNGETMVMLVSM